MKVLRQIVEALWHDLGVASLSFEELDERGLLVEGLLSGVHGSADKLYKFSPSVFRVFGELARFCMFEVLVDAFVEAFDAVEAMGDMSRACDFQADVADLLLLAFADRGRLSPLGHLGYSVSSLHFKFGQL